VLENGWYV